MNSVLGRRQAGFTLVEIAIVLVIIGLILGGVLKGQELVTSARVRNIADQQNAIKAAFFAFQDRYKAIPGDYSGASLNIPGLSGKSVDGNNDGFVANGTSGAELTESVWGFVHLTAAGFISCSQCMSAGITTASGTGPLASNSPVNAFGGALQLSYDNVFGDSANPPNAANNVKTGSNIPSNILAEVDNKLDDGSPYAGTFQFSAFAPSGGTAPAAASCLTGTPARWSTQTPSNNCGAAYTF